MAVKKGDKIKIEYTGTFEDGTVFDSSEKHGNLLEFEVGAGEVIKGLDVAVIGMNMGEEKDIKISPSKAYGDYNPQLVKKIPRNKLPEGQEPKEGMVLVVTTPSGVKLPARIAGVTDKEITIDLNHPLAGKVLNFRIKIAEVSS